MINNKILNAAQLFLKDYSGILSNRGCNDLPYDFYDGWSEDEKNTLSEWVKEWNGEGTTEEDVRKLMNYDWCVCGAIALYIFFKARQ